MKTRPNLSILITLNYPVASFAPSSAAQADCRDGCSGNNTFLGEEALLDTTNSYNTGIGYLTLYYGGDDAEYHHWRVSDGEPLLRLLQYSMVMLQC